MALGSSVRMNSGQIPNPSSDNTLKTGSEKGRLAESAKLVNRISFDRRLLEELKKARVGTLKIESEALRLNEDSTK